MGKRDILIVAAITVIALGAAFAGQLLLGPKHLEVPLPVPPRSAVLPDPPPAGVAAPILRVRLVDAGSGERVEHGATLILKREGMIEQFRGRSNGSDLLVSGIEEGEYELGLRHPNFLSPQASSIALQAGITKDVEYKLERLHDVTLQPSISDPNLMLLGMARADPPLVRWAPRGPEGFRFQVPAGAYVLCMPMRDLRTDLQGRPLLHADALEREPKLAIPARCAFGTCEITGPGVLEPQLAPELGQGSIRGRVEVASGEPGAYLDIEAVRLGPGPFRHVAAAAVTDSEQAFTISELAAGSYLLRSRQGFGVETPVEVAGAEVQAVVRLEFMSQGSKLGSLQVQILQNGQPAAGAYLMLSGRWNGGVLEPVRPVQNVGEPTAYPGLLEWLHVKPGSYELMTFPATTSRLTVHVHAGAEATAALELSPPGTGGLQVMTPLAEGTLVRVLTEQRQVSLEVAAGRGGVVRVWGLKPGPVYLESTGHPELEGTVIPGEAITLQWPWAAREGDD